MAVATGSAERLHMEALVGVPEATPAASAQDHPSLRRRERSSLLKNRMREICTSGSVRGGDGNIPAYSATDRLPIDAPFRPDGFYGLSKVWGEAMTRMYWDNHGIEGVSIRIGSALERPTEFRHLSTWLGHDDLVQLLMCCIKAPEVGYLAVWGVSNNTRSYYDIS